MSGLRPASLLVVRQAPALRHAIHAPDYALEVVPSLLHHLLSCRLLHSLAEDPHEVLAPIEDGHDRWIDMIVGGQLHYFPFSP